MLLDTVKTLMAAVDTESLILSTLQKISGKQSEVLVCALLLTAGRQEGARRDV